MVQPGYREFDDTSGSGDHTKGLGDMFFSPRGRGCLAILVTLTVASAGCSSGDDGASGSTTSDVPSAETEAPETGPTTTSAPVETGGSATTAPPDDAAPTVTSTPVDTQAPVELTATARGVTADTITIGYSYIDFDELKALSLSDGGWGDQELQFQTAVDDLNARGGVNGRRLEVVYEPYSVLGTENAEAVCLELTDDHEVFAILGGFLGPAEAANTCIVGRGNTVLVGGVQSEERLADATAPWLSTRPLRTRQADVLLSLLESEGMLADASVAVVASIDADDVLDDVVASFEAAGVAPVEVLRSEAPIGDIVVENDVWATLAERIRDVGADTVLLVGNPSAGIRGVAANGLDVDVWALDEESLTELGNTVDIEDARGTLTVAGLDGQALWDDETMRACRETFAAAHPEVEIIDPVDLQAGDDDWPMGLSVGCRFLELFVLVAEAAGPDLTPDSFAAAAATQFEEFSIVGQPFSSLGPDKFDANDSFALVSFDPDMGDAGGFEQITEIRDTTR